MRKHPNESMSVKYDEEVAKLKAHVQKLREVRKHASASFFNRSKQFCAQDGEQRATSSSGGATPSTPAGRNSTSELRTDSPNNKHSLKLQATVKLLSDSLEEASNLRALLEYTADPNIRNILEKLQEDAARRAASGEEEENNTVIQHSHSADHANMFSANIRGNEAVDGISINLGDRLRARSIMLEQEKLVNQVPVFSPIFLPIIFLP